jgi:oligoendopeptidase F
MAVRITYFNDDGDKTVYYSSREKVISELKDKFDDYNKEIEAHNEKVIKEFEEEDPEVRKINEGARKVIELHKKCLKLVETFENFVNSL